jgi:hypothetical protein
MVSPVPTIAGYRWRSTDYYGYNTTDWQLAPASFEA